jgi:DNA-binding IclR family transcriptional regulator
MTSSQKKYLDAFARYVLEEGEAPTMRELSGIVGASPQACHKMMLVLMERGVVKRGAYGGKRNFSLPSDSETGQKPNG